MKNHTPTPWKTFVDRKIYSQNGKTLITDLAYLSNNDPEENKANAAFIVKAVNAHEDTMRMMDHIESWLRDPFFVKDEAHCLQKAYEVAQALAKAEGSHVSK